MSLPLALQPQANPDKDEKSLQHLIARINEERGSFRDVDEAKLKEEIARDLATDVEAQGNENEDVEEPQDAESRRKEVYTARNEMLKLIGQAQNEALTALDFVSLLLSKEAPRAESSISPFLKSHVPTGALDFDRSQASQQPAHVEEQVKNVATGWNLTSLNSSADKLLGAAQRLEKEMEKETKYWNQVLSVSQKGWSTCRMPRERHTVGVRFGFSEAGPLFSGRGLAALRPDADGDIVLDQGLIAKGKIIRVKVLKHGEAVQESALPPAQLATAELESVIHQARDSLFDEELFHEITKEARTLASWGVVVEGESIRLPIDRLYEANSARDSASQAIIVELVPQDTHVTDMQTTDNADAEAVALMLRLLMADVHQRRFNHRARPPPPLSDEKLKASTHDILQTVMNCLSHKHCVTTLVKQIRTMQIVLPRAGFPTTYECSTQHNIHFDTKKSISGSIGALLASQIRKPMRTSISWEISGFDRQTIIITSHLGQPTFGSTFKLETGSSASLKLEARSLRKILDVIISDTVKNLLQQVLPKCPEWISDDETGGLRRKSPSGRRGSIDTLELSLDEKELVLSKGKAIAFSSSLKRRMSTTTTKRMIWWPTSATSGLTAKMDLAATINAVPK